MSGVAGPELRDIHLPVEPSWWPPAPGWWVLAGLAALLLVWLLRVSLRRRARARRQRSLLLAFDAIQRRHARDADGAALVASLSELLRRATHAHAPASALLQGDAWLDFLDRNDGSRPFRSGAGRLLLDGPWRPHVPRADADALAALVRHRLPRLLDDAHA
jgi:hypothetical protein